MIIEDIKYICDYYQIKVYYQFGGTTINLSCNKVTLWDSEWSRNDGNNTLYNWFAKRLSYK